MADLEAVAKRIASGGKVRTAGKIEFVKDQGPVRRDVRVKGYKWSPDALRDLAKILWAGQRAHSYAMAALRIFSKMPSSEFSPDGLLGGRGYIQTVKDMRSSLANTVETLSSFTDTVHDEVNADHWAVAEKKADIGDIVSDAEKVKSDPEEFVEGEFAEDEPLVNPPASNPKVEGDDSEEEEEEEEGSGSQLPPDVPRTSSEVGYDRYSVAFDNLINRVASSHLAGGALDEQLVPGMEPTITDRDLGGPRAFPIGPAEGNGELGNYDDPCCPENPSDSAMEEQELLLNSLCLPLAEDPLSGADFQSKMSATILPESYSWLPGADNKKSMNWYAPGLTEKDLEWMDSHCQPEMPKGILPESQGLHSESLWDGIRAR